MSKKLSRQQYAGFMASKETVQSNKRKHIAKEKHFKPEVKLLKINSQKNQKKTTKQRNTQALHQSDLWKVFKIHSRSKITFQQCLFSLKLLGCQWTEKKANTKFQTLWNDKPKSQIDFSTFQEVYYELNSKQSLQVNRQLFELLSLGNKVVTTEGLTNIAEYARWNGSAKQIIDNFGRDGKLTFEEFNRAMNLASTLY